MMARGLVRSDLSTAAKEEKGLKVGKTDKTWAPSFEMSIDELQDHGKLWIWLEKVQDEMINAMSTDLGYGSSPEDRSRALLKVYEDRQDRILEIRRVLSAIDELHEATLEALKAQEDARLKDDHRGRTIRSRGGCLVLKLVPCGKDCNGCPHGPYAYQVTKVGGKQIWKYLGRRAR